MPSTAVQSASQPLEVLEMNEAFEEVNGRFGFASTLVVYQDGNHVYHASSKARYASASEIEREHLSDTILIPASAYMPLFPSTFKRAPEPLPCKSYVKKPRLASYDRVRKGPRPNHIADDILVEAEVCELLKRHPHPNIAEYLGCQVSDGRIQGLCFAKYGQTLMQVVNPQSCMKRMSRNFRATRQNLRDDHHILEGIGAGIRHLHSLGLVHNDINPSNVMLDGDAVVLIDFGSCRPEGGSLRGVGRTYEWYDETAQTSSPKNDLNAMEEIRLWLGEDSVAFQFEE